MWKSLFNAFCRVFACRCHSDCDLSTGAKITTPKKQNAETIRKARSANDGANFTTIDLTTEDV
jgi:hypothetical protein